MTPNTSTPPALFYIHSPIRDPVLLTQMVSIRTPESVHLDFKADFWIKSPTAQREPQQEAAKDIAAFANSEGGTLVLGVSDSNDCASGWNPDFKIGRRRQQLETWLVNALSPASLASHIEILEFTIQTGTGVQDALVINVPPWPYGVVGVHWKDGAWLFPFRLNKDTKLLHLEEAMERNDTSRRPLYLKTKRLIAETPLHEELGGNRLRFTSPVVQHVSHLLGSGPSRGTVPVPLVSGCHGALMHVDNDAILVKMAGYGWGYEKLPGEDYLSRPEMKILAGKPLSVPLELVSAIWKGAENPGSIHIALHATVCWMDLHWALYTQGL